MIRLCDTITNVYPTVLIAYRPSSAPSATSPALALLLFTLFLFSARVAGLEKDLGILPTQYGGYGYNLLLTGFYVSICKL